MSKTLILSRSPPEWSRSLNEVLGLSLVLWIIYFLECVSWVPETSFVFRTKCMLAWKPANSIFPIERFGNRIFLANPVPGLGDLVVCGPLRPTGASSVSANLQEQFRRVLDTQSARRRLRLCRRLVRPLYVDSYLLFALVFGVFPIVAWHLGLFMSLLMLPLFLFLVVNIACTFRRIHCTLKPTALAERREKLIALLLSPVGAIRAPAVLIRQSIADFHPLAVAAAVMPHREARRFTAQILRDLTFSVRDTENESSIETEWRLAVWEWTRKEFGDPGLLVGAPVQRFHASVSYCPRCEQEYVVGVGVCVDCGGVALKPF